MMETQDLIITNLDPQELFECPVCFTLVGQKVTLRDCLHDFCKYDNGLHIQIILNRTFVICNSRECLIGAVQYAEDSEVKCPFRDNNYSCDSSLQEREIKAVRIPI